MVAIQPKIYTKEEYLALEEKAEFKNEYHDGEIISLTSETLNHNKIILNFCCQFQLALRKTNYEICICEIKLWIEKWKRCLYPDLMIFEGQPVYEYENENTTIVNNPSIIIEVLSNSTESYDKGNKFKYYRSIPSLKEYILIEQYEPYIEHFIKQSENEWLLKTYQGENQNLTLSSVEFQIAFSDIYKEINFEVK